MSDAMPTDERPGPIDMPAIEADVNLATAPSEPPTTRCGHEHQTRFGDITVRCTRPADHSGKHAGMGCEWSS